jgi:hypothetical protein
VLGCYLVHHLRLVYGSRNYRRHCSIPRIICAAGGGFEELFAHSISLYLGCHDNLMAIWANDSALGSN